MRGTGDSVGGAKPVGVAWALGTGRSVEAVSVPPGEGLPGGGPAVLDPTVTEPVVADPEVADPRLDDPAADGDHERMTHIVLEGYRAKIGGFLRAGPSVAEGIVNGTAVKALCGKVWVPNRDPKRYPVCPTCREIAQGKGWKVPG